MRDTFLGLLLLAGMVGAYAYFQKSDLGKPKLGSAPSARATHAANSKRGVNPQHGKGRHEGTNPFESKRAETLQPGEGDSVASTEAEGGLPSLYEDEERSGPAESSAAVTSGEPVRRPRRATKVVHGVPVDTMARARRDKLPLPAVTADSGSGLRVFFQCLELKRQGTEALTERECSRLVARQPIVADPLTVGRDR